MRKSTGANQTNPVRIAKHSAMGRLTKAIRSPLDLIIEVMKFSSNMPPSTTPKMAGAVGNLLASSR